MLNALRSSDLFDIFKVCLPRDTFAHMMGWDEENVKMVLLITTSRSFLKLDLLNSCILNIHQGKGLYYGIAKSPENYFVAARNRMVSSNVCRTEERGEILIFDLQFNEIGSLSPPFPLRDMHEMAWYKGKLWVTCPYDNLIAIWDGYTWERWFPLQEDLDGIVDIHHYNSFLFENNIVWLLAHNNGYSELFAFSFYDKKLIKSIKMGNHAHNIWREGKQLFTCSSADGKIVSETKNECETGGFPRGYIQFGNKRFVGINEPAERKARDGTTSHVLMYSTDWKLLRKFDLPGQGMILDITCCHC